MIPTPPMPLEEALELYTQGLCHVLAVALHRKLGWEIVLALNPEADFWEDPDDPDNGIPEVLHAYAVDPQGRAWDIRGHRPQEAIREDTSELIGNSEVDTDWLANEGEMAMYVGEWADDGEEPIDRPLIAYTDQDVEEAWAVACALIPGLPQPSPAVLPKSGARAPGR